MEKIATGGMGEIFLAKQKGPTGYQKLVAVKRLLPHLTDEQDIIDMFFDEARIAALLDHPNIAQIYDLGEERGEYYLAMEYVHGENLRTIGQRAADTGKGIPLSLKCRIVAEAAAALDFAHYAKGPNGQPLQVIHRDVSPPNVIVGFNGVVKLVDFGVAKAANKVTRTASGIIKGKYAYMSPEQARDQDLDHRSDIFSLGILFYELLTGTRLFKRPNDTATLKAVVGEEVKPPSLIVKGIPKAVDAVVLKALERKREARFQSAGAMREAINAFLDKQKLKATQAQLGAFMKELFPEKAGEDDAEEPTWSASVALPMPPPRPSAPTRGSNPRAKPLDEKELGLRVAATQVSDTVPGGFCIAVAPDQSWMEDQRYATADFLKLLWKAVEELAPQVGDVDEAFIKLGAACLDRLLRSPAGHELEELAETSAPHMLARPLLDALQPLIRPGERKVVATTPSSALIVFKDDVLPIQLYAGLLSAAFEKLRGVQVATRWEKPAASRIELRLSW
jgi:serine/threonine-protein kinase